MFLNIIAKARLMWLALFVVMTHESECHNEGFNAPAGSRNLLCIPDEQLKPRYLHASLLTATLFMICVQLEHCSLVDDEAGYQSFAGGAQGTRSQRDPFSGGYQPPPTNPFVQPSTGGSLQQRDGSLEEHA